VLNFRLIDSGWDKVVDEAVNANHASILIVCPFIKVRAAGRLLRYGRPKLFQLITRFNLNDFAAGVSDPSALRLLIKNGAQVRGVRNLHAKLYLIGEGCAILSSANLTEAALLTNHELGFIAKTPEVVDACRRYFQSLWHRAGQNLHLTRLAGWERRLATHSAGGMRRETVASLGDEGTSVGLPPTSIVLPPWVGRVGQSFVKFFGEAHKRENRFTQVLTEVNGSGSHWACAYPKGKRPRGVQDGAVMYMGRLVKDPNDILIYGRAVAIRHMPGRDDATADDIRRREWKAKWPHYVRVYDAEFIAGSLNNGVSLNELMDVLSADSYASTQRNASMGAGNTDPRKALMQQPAVQLSPQGAAWLDERLESAFAKCGRLTPSMLERLDWSPTPFQEGDDD